MVSNVLLTVLLSKFFGLCGAGECVGSQGRSMSSKSLVDRVLSLRNRTRLEFSLRVFLRRENGRKTPRVIVS